MNTPPGPPALLTDLYQLTMMQAYRSAGIADHPACFDLFFRRAPFGGSYAIACGVDQALDDLAKLRFADEDLRYLRSLDVLDADFVDSLANFRFTGDVLAVEEGAVVFAREPILRVEAPLQQAQLVETMLLNRINFQTLIATKASRVVQAARGRSVLEFGLRRAQGQDGGLSASRAAMVGGCSATSNVEAGRLFDVPVKGTHAHSYVTAFDDEESAFRNYAAACPRDVVLLVDTYDTLGQGIPAAIEVGLELKRQGGALGAIRLDSGDFSVLSVAARKMLNGAGLSEVKIVVSNDLDEYAIADLLAKRAPIDVFGVGTKLACAFDEPALGGVYKLSAMQREDGSWRPVSKRSEDKEKATLPGRKQVWRQCDGAGTLVQDRIELDGAGAGPGDPQLLLAYSEGSRTRPAKTVAAAAERAAEGLAALPGELRSLTNAAAAPVELGPALRAAFPG